MILSRRTARPKPGARGSLNRNPSSSGPRCRSAAAIARTRGTTSSSRLTSATPQIPHTRLLDLRRTEEGRARPEEMFAQVEAMYSQTTVGVPRQKKTQRQKEQHADCGHHQGEEGFAFQQQAPVQ